MLGFSDGLSSTLPFSVANTFPEGFRWDTQSDLSLKLLPPSLYKADVCGRAAVGLTWHRDKELDGVAMAMEAELSLGHGAVGDEATAVLVRAVVSVHVDDPPTGGRGHLVGWGGDSRVVVAKGTESQEHASICRCPTRVGRLPFEGASLLIPLFILYVLFTLHMSGTNGETRPVCRWAIYIPDRFVEISGRTF